MKKILMLILCITAISAAQGCGKKSETPTSAPEATPTPLIVENGTIATTSENGKIKVMLPVSIFGDNAVEMVETIKVNREFEDASIGDDGYVTFTMTEAQHELWKSDAKESARKSAEQIISDERYVGLKSVEFNEDCTEATVVTDKAAYKSERDAVAAEGIANSVFFYQSMSGKSIEALSCSVNFVDEATGEVLETLTFPKTA